MDTLAAFSILCIAISNILAGDSKSTSTVLDFGAIGDGKTDDSQAFLKAWEAVCGAASVGTPGLKIPRGTFLLKPVDFAGPCKSKGVHIWVLGKIIAPSTIDGWGNCQLEFWLSFHDIEGLVLHGSGEIDGQGIDWWKNAKNRGCKRPKALHFHNCNNLKLKGLTHVNSPKGHIAVNGCNGVSISNLRIIAPEDSPNTDGIDISQSTHVNIYDSNIGTGDDCVAIGAGSSFINVTNIVCGPGHGISVGSLGEYGSNDTVKEVHVRYCNLTRTQNGVRIKTWQGGLGYAGGITFEQIRLNTVQNPIIIDQHYCNGEQNCEDKPQAVKVSDVTYTGIYGTSAVDQAITLDCAKICCNNINMNQINIKSCRPGMNIHAYCRNAYGRSTSTVPNVPCLSG